MAQNSSNNTRYWRRALSVAAGATTACFLAPVIAGYAGVSLAGIVIANVATGVIGSTVSTVTNNLITDESLEVEYRPYDAQVEFRSSISNFLDAQLFPVIQAIRQRREDAFHRVLEVQLQNNLRVLQFAAEVGTKVLLQFNFVVRRRAGTEERRNPDQGTAPRPLQNYTNPNATQRYQLPVGFAAKTRSILDGIGWSVACGVGAGALGAAIGPLAPAFRVIQTAPGTGILVGIPTATGIGASALDLTRQPSELEKISFCIHFAAELQEYINRVIECAGLNQVDLQYQVRAGVGTLTTGGPNGSNVASGVTWTGFWYDASN